MAERLNRSDAPRAFTIQPFTHADSYRRAQSDASLVPIADPRASSKPRSPAVTFC